MAAQATTTAPAVNEVQSYLGTSSDFKPTLRTNGQAVDVGSTFFEKDTNRTFQFDGTLWNPVADGVLAAVLEEVQGVRHEVKRSNELLEQIAEHFKNNE